MFRGKRFRHNLIVDDLVATAGTMLAAAKLVEKLGGRVAGIAYVIDLPELKGKEKLKDYNVFSSSKK